MNIDTTQLATDMINAAKGVVGEKWPATQAYFESESKMFAERLATIARMRVDGDISESRAKQHVEMQKEAWETTLLAVQGLNQLMVEEALNAALKIVKDTVNTAIGFALL
jgi:hypothetical protein